MVRETEWLWGREWETPRQKQNAHACDDICFSFFFFKMADFLELLKMLKTAGNYGFKTLADTCEIVDRLLPTLKSPQNLIHSPVTIDFCSCNLIQIEHVSEFVDLVEMVTVASEPLRCCYLGRKNNT